MSTYINNVYLIAVIAILTLGWELIKNARAEKPYLDVYKTVLWGIAWPTTFISVTSWWIYLWELWEHHRSLQNLLFLSGGTGLVGGACLALLFIRAYRK